MGRTVLRTIYRQIPQFLKRREMQESETKSVHPKSEGAWCSVKGLDFSEEDTGHENDQIRFHQKQSAYCS